MRKEISKKLREYLAALGSKGGKARAKKHSKAALSAWGKKGGRPPANKVKKEKSE